MTNDPGFGVWIAQAVWVSMAITGTAIQTVVLQTAITDREILIRLGRNGHLRVLAKHAVRSEALRWIRMLCYMAAGLVSLVSPPSPRLETTRAGIALLLVLITADDTYGTWDARRERKKTLAMIIEQQDQIEEASGT